MFFRTFNIKTSLSTQSILNALQRNSYPMDSRWNTNEFDNKITTAHTYIFQAKNGTFRLQVRKTNQRRKSRPICFGKIVDTGKKREINVRVVPHIASLLVRIVFLLIIFSFMIVAQNISQIVSSALFLLAAGYFFYTNLKYDTKDIEMHIYNVLKDYNTHH